MYVFTVSRGPLNRGSALVLPFIFSAPSLLKSFVLNFSYFHTEDKQDMKCHAFAEDEK